MVGQALLALQLLIGGEAGGKVPAVPFNLLGPYLVGMSAPVISPLVILVPFHLSGELLPIDTDGNDPGVG